MHCLCITIIYEYILLRVKQLSYIVCSMARIFAIIIIIIFQAVRRAINVLNVSTCI